MQVNEPTSDPTLNLALDTISKGKQAIVFANTKNSAEKTAEEISKKIKQKDPKLDQLSETALKSLSSPTKQCKRLARCLKKGIAFHHAGLTAGQKELIEENFRKKLIKVIAATPTLAAGLDLPAYRVILKDLRRFSQRGLQYIPVLEYLQMAGRAGRPRFDDKGEAVIVASSESHKDELYERYILGRPEPIYSKLAVEPVLRTYLLSLIASGFTTKRSQIFSFFQETFWAHQFADTKKLNTKIESILDLLEEWEFLKTDGKESGEFVSAHVLHEDDPSYRATLLGKRIAELYVDPYTAHFFVEAQKKSKQTPHPFALLHLISSTLEIRPYLRTRVKDHDMIDEALIAYGDELLSDEPSIYDPDYEEFQNTIKTALFMHDWIEECQEEELLEKYNIRPGEIKAKLDIADWLVYCQEEIARILHNQRLMPELKRLRIRLKYGVKEELLPLLRFKGIGRVRARKLFYNRIRDVKAIKDIDITSLIQILGKSTALALKNQVGQEFKHIKPNKRKGQISLQDYNE